MFRKNNLATLAAEFLGAGVLTLVVVGVQHSTIGVPYFVGIAAALAAVMLVLVFSSVSGAVLNPALTVALWTVRRLKTVPAVTYLVVQLLGAWVAYYLFTYFTQNPLNPLTSDFTWQIALAEAVGAMVLAFGWAAAVYGRYSVGYKAVAVGLGYALGIVIASSAALGLINPAVALADRAWYIWGADGGWGNYVLGPVVGAVVGMNLWAWLFAGELKLSTARVTSKAAATKTATKTKNGKATTKRKTTSRRRK